MLRATFSPFPNNVFFLKGYMVHVNYDILIMYTNKVTICKFEGVVEIKLRSLHILSTFTIQSRFQTNPPHHHPCRNACSPLPGNGPARIQKLWKQENMLVILQKGLNQWVSAILF